MQSEAPKRVLDPRRRGIWTRTCGLWALTCGIWAVTCGIPAVCRAVEVTLRDGRVWEGAIVRESADEIVLKTSGGDVSISKESVLSVDRSPTRREQYQTRLAAIDAKDPDQHYLLGLWCRRQGLKRESEYHLNYACGLDPDHAGARRALGQVRYEGKWMPEAEAKDAMGMRLVDGRWMTKEAAALAEAEALKRDLARQVARQVDAIAEVLANPKNDQARYDAEDRLAAMRDPLAYDAVLALARHENPDVRRAALRAADRINIPGVGAETLAHALYDTDPYVRERARKILERRWDESMLVETLKALRDPDTPPVRFAAALVLGVARPYQAIEPLIEQIYTAYRVKRASGEAAPMLGIRGYQVREGGVDGRGPVVYDPTAGVVGAGPGGTWKPLDAPDDDRSAYLVNYAALDALRAITRKDFGLSKRAWRDWWHDNKDDFRGFKPPAP